jgi:hypothetical protein
MTRNWLKILPLAAMTATLGGCLQKETTHSLYLSPDGAVTWTAFEKDVRSDENDAAKRQKEEQQYLTAALAGTHGIGAGLAALDHVSLRTLVLRKDRPFIVMTEAELGPIDRLFSQMLAEIDTPGWATLRREGSRTTLTIHVEVGPESDQGTSSPVIGLFEDLDRYRVVLTAGRFVTATGFNLVDDGTAAIPREITEDTLAENGGVIDLTLTWDTATPTVTSGPRTSSDRSSR